MPTEESEPEVRLASLLASLDRLSDQVHRRKEAMEKVWARAVTIDPECQRLFNLVQEKIFILNSMKPATDTGAKVNVTEYVNRAYLFSANSTGSDEITASDDDLKRIFRKIAKLTHPDMRVDGTEDFLLARTLYKARDLTGLTLLWCRIGGLEGVMSDVGAEKLLKFTDERISAIKNIISQQEQSPGWAALTEVQRGADPVPKVRTILKRWHQRLEEL